MKKSASLMTVLAAAALLSVPAFAQPTNTAPGSPTAPVAAAPGDVAASTETMTTTTTETTETDMLAADTGGTLQNTGGEPMLFVLGGIALMGTALVMRRSARSAA